MSYAIHQSHFDLCKTTACLQCGLISSECFKVYLYAEQYICIKRLRCIVDYVDSLTSFITFSRNELEQANDWATY